MNVHWDAVGAIAELLGAIAVFVTLIYLAIQIRSSAIVGRATIEQLGFDSHAKGFEALVNQPELNGLMGRFISGEQLNNEEMMRVHPFLLWVLDSHQNNFVQHRLGLFDSDSYEAQWGRISRIYFNANAIKWMAAYTSEYRHDFIEEFQARLGKIDPDLAAQIWQR